jgi:flagellar basal body-associated protein FliL
MQRFVIRFWTLAFAAALFGGTASAENGAPKHKVTQSKSFVSIEPMYATVIDADKPCGMLLVEIGLDIPDEALRASATTALPILRDYYVRSLTSFTASTVRPWRQPDVTVIAERLQRVTDRALKRKGARVLLAQVALRITR